jgi:polyisoprenoid-binding protein YceI
MHPNSRKFLVLVAMAALALPAWVAADAHRTFQVKKDGKSRIAFVSDAPLETINGVSSQLHGSMKLDPSDLSKVSGTLQAPVASFGTGIDLRDRHLRSDKWLNADKHPNITFEIERVEGLRQFQKGKTHSFKIHGKASMNGKTNPVVAEARARYYPPDEARNEDPSANGGFIRGRARFQIKLSDYDVGIPVSVRLKVSNEITVNIDLRAVAG